MGKLIGSFSTQQSRAIYLSCLLLIVIGTFSVGAEESDKSHLYLNLRDLESTDAFAQEVERFARLFNEAEQNAELRLKGLGSTINNPRKSFYSHPTTLRFLLPFKWIGVSDQIPISLLTDGTHLEGKNPYLNPSSILTGFNIRLVSQLDDSRWPESAILTIKLNSYDGSETKTILADMVWNQFESAYYFHDANSSLQLIADSVQQLMPRDYKENGYDHYDYYPEVRIVSLTGFEDLIAEIEPVNFPRGIEVSHSVQVGQMSIGFGFSWLGRPAEILAIHPPQLLN